MNFPESFLRVPPPCVSLGEVVEPKTAAQKQNPKTKPDGDANSSLRGSGTDWMRFQESMSERFPAAARSQKQRRRSQDEAGR